MRRNSVLGLVVATAAALAVTASAQAALPITMTVTPSTTQAGAHANFQVDVSFNRTGSNAEHPKSIVLHLPAGLIGDPSAATPCSMSDFQGGTCDASAVVGSSTIAANATVLGAVTPVTASGSVYLLTPGAGQTALLGVDLAPTGFGGLVSNEHIRSLSVVSVRDTTDSGLDSTLDSLPETTSTTLGTADVSLTSLQLTLNASASQGKFESNPTACGVNTTALDLTTYEDPGTVTHASAPFTTTGCENVPFTPSLTVTPDTTRHSANAAFSAKISVPGTDTGGIRQSHISSTIVKLPLGVGLNPGLAGALTACTDGEFGLGSHAAAVCPAASQIGTVSLDTPVVGTITGQVYLGQPTPAALLRLFVVVNGPGFLVKLAGTNTLDPATGQVTATFSGLPQIPFTAFTLNFNGGDHSVLTTPPTCGPAKTTATLVPFSGAAPAVVDSTFTVDADGHGAPCAAQGFNPTLDAVVSPTQAGAATTNTITLGRHDDDQLLKDVTVSLPPGVAGSLKGVPFCSDAAANAGTCPADTQVGEVAAQAGVGPAPLAISGKVYLAGPGDGALARLAIVLPGAVGPFDFGNLVSFADLKIRTADAGLDVVTNNLPNSLAGIPLGLRQIALSLNRKGFALNATSCAKQTISAVFTSTQGATATASSPYQATGCDKLKFAPKVKVTLSGNVHGGGLPKIATEVIIPAGQSAASKVQLTLPHGLAASITGRVQACSLEQQAVNACEKSAQIGTAIAQTPLLPIPLTGPVYFAQLPGGAVVPGLRVVLNPLGLVVTGATAPTTTGSSRIVTTFNGLPDTPLTSFALTFTGGKAGVIGISGFNFCGKKSAVATGSFAGHNGGKASTKATVSVVGCAPQLSVHASRLGKSTATVSLKIAASHGGAGFTSVRFTLPRSLTVSALKTSQRSLSAGKGAKVKRTSSRVLTVTLPKKGAKSATLVLKRGAVHGRKGGTIVVRSVDTSKKTVTQRIKLKG